MPIRPLSAVDLPAVRELAREADAEGFRFVWRFVASLEQQRVALDAAEEFFLAAVENGHVVGLGGVTPDPYSADPTTGRLRHLYISPGLRRRGIGRALIVALETRATLRYQRLRLRTDTPDAARFYERLGYTLSVEPGATHARELTGDPARST
jgi:ribosomal protein S18 acetylase RimI-like enzyme